MDMIASNGIAFGTRRLIGIFVSVSALIGSTPNIAVAGFDSNVIRGPVVFSPGARIKLDCPRSQSAPPSLSDVQGFGHVSHPVKFKLQYAPSVGQSKNDIPGTEQLTKDYVVSLNSFLGNFPGAGYYALVMRNTNAFPVSLPDGEQLGVICQ